MEYQIKDGTRAGALEVYFEGKPDSETRQALKDNGARWNSTKNCWWLFADRALLEGILTGATLDTGANKANGAKAESQNFFGYPVLDNLNLQGIHKTEAGTRYEGWSGSKTWTDGNDLKKKILTDCKKAGIKATIRQRRGGWTTAITTTLYIKRSEIKSYDEFMQNKTTWDIVSLCDWNNYTTPEGKIDMIYGAKIDQNDKALIDNILHTTYQVYVDGLDNSESSIKYHKDILKDTAYQRASALEAIVREYNHDNSDSQTDYFDRGIYDYYSIKVID